MTLGIVCGVCGQEVKDHNGLMAHARLLHKMSGLEYMQKYEGFQIPKCPFCGKDCKAQPSLRFSKTCGSKECAKKSQMATNQARYGAAFSLQSQAVREKSVQTCLARYNVTNPAKLQSVVDKRKATSRARYNCDNPAQSEEVKSKRKETFLAHFGTDHPLKNESIKAKRDKTNIARYGFRSPMKNKAVQEKSKQTNLVRYNVPWSQQNEAVHAKSEQTNLARYNVRNQFQREEVKEKSKQTNLALYGVEHASQSPIVRDKIRNTNLARYNCENQFQRDEVKEKARQTLLARYGVEHSSQIPEVHKRQCSHRKDENGGYLSRAEKKLAEMLTNRHIPFQYEYLCNGHHFDFALFKDRQLKCLVEVDGEYNHGLVSDSDGKLVKGDKDEIRFSLVPDGVKFVAIDSLKLTEENISSVLATLDVDYEEWISSIVSSLPADFPYPQYDEKRMRRDYEHLKAYKWKSGQRLGTSIIDHFHRSIWSGHVGNYPSPVEAWADKNLLEKCVRNRFIYKSNLSSQNIARGFNVCKLAPKVSVFNPALAKHLLDVYAPGAKSVIDPFSGFSGRMLGACALGMSYTGYDLSETAVKESNEIIQFLGLNARVEQGNVFELNGDADVLFTCPPYGLKETWGNETKDLTCERWIDECLARFNCKRYIFVADESVGKYRGNVVETLTNQSHFSNAKEYVILMERANPLS